MPADLTVPPFYLTILLDGRISPYKVASCFQVPAAQQDRAVDAQDGVH